MAQGDFTKDEAEFIRKAANELFEGIPKSHRMKYLGHLNDILLFILAARDAAPNATPGTNTVNAK